MQIADKKSGKNVKLIVIISISVLLALLLAAGTVFALQVSKLNYDKIYDGVSIGTIEVGKMSIEEAKELVEKSYTIDESREITLSCENEEATLSLKEADIKIDALKSAENAFAVGRSGSYNERLKELSDIKKNGVTINVALTYNEDVVNAKIDEIANIVDVPERPLTVDLDGDELVITRGKKGMRILKETAIKQIGNAILDTSELNVILKKEEVVPPELNMEYIKKEICTKPQDASYKIENQRLTIIDEKIGVEIDTKEAERILEETPGDVVRIPAKITQPNITAEKIKASLFPDLLGTYSTDYNAGNVSRSHNVALACEMISDVVLAPGDVFSYNDTLGPRTAERGYREAGVYVGNRVEQGLGGGICQVSTTLFNSVVLADLNIVYRTNHSMPVSYAPPGRDATVSYGSIDFKFSNNTKNPIKIVASAVGGKNTVSIYGIKENPNRTIEITSECTGSWGPKVKQIEDPTLPEGTTEVEVAGSGGSSYVAYKITKENGKVVKTEELTRSTYSATDKVVRVGTKKEAQELPTPAPQTAPSVAPTPPVSEPEPAPIPEPAPVPEPVAPEPAPDTVAEPDPEPAQPVSEN